MRAREVLRRIDSAKHCVRVRQKGSHILIKCAGKGHSCSTVVPVHPGDLGSGLLRAIERDLEPCLGKGWLHE
ncbi:MAG TPA: type II toxin-antitoxin system HicA family toxin [Actinomycetota bacterium]|nr:type II toxin-antitoxin system HicA family toxin [Actinomycetota bacterium]